MEAESNMLFHTNSYIPPDILILWLRCAGVVFLVTGVLLIVRIIKDSLGLSSRLVFPIIVVLLGVICTIASFLI